MDWFGPLIGIVGALLGVVLGSVLTGRQDRLRWQRQWLTSRIGERTTYTAAVCRALDAQQLLHDQVADAVLGKRRPLPTERVQTADAAWREVLATRYVYAADDLQRALAAFDQSREASTLALNAKNAAAIEETSQRLFEARVNVLDAIQATTNDINAALGGHLIALPVRFWLWLRRRPAHPVAPMPSEMRRQGDPSQQRPEGREQIADSSNGDE